MLVDVCHGWQSPTHLQDIMDRSCQKDNSCMGESCAKTKARALTGTTLYIFQLKLGLGRNKLNKTSCDALLGFGKAVLEDKEGKVSEEPIKILRAIYDACA
jgi:hypothetical protein